MNVREILAGAVTEVDGITAHPYFVQNTSPGTAMIRLDRIEYPDRFGGIVHWSVVLILPQDYAESERFIETYVPAIRETLKPHLTLTTIQPQRLDLNPGILPCVFINGHREE